MVVERTCWKGNSPSWMDALARHPSTMEKLLRGDGFSFHRSFVCSLFLDTGKLLGSGSCPLLLKGRSWASMMENG